MICKNCGKDYYTSKSKYCVRCRIIRGDNRYCLTKAGVTKLKVGANIRAAEPKAGEKHIKTYQEYLEEDRRRKLEGTAKIRR